MSHLQNQKAQRAKKLIYCMAGWMALALGTAGIFLPLLPTVPFVLLASFCFSRGSDHFHRWLLASPWLGPIVKDWELHRRIKRATKYRATIILAISLSLSSWALWGNWPLQGVLLVCGLLAVAIIWTRSSR